MFGKHLWKSDILSKGACKNQIPGLSVSGTLVENGLIKCVHCIEHSSFEVQILLQKKFIVTHFSLVLHFYTS